LEGEAAMVPIAAVLEAMEEVAEASLLEALLKDQVQALSLMVVVGLVDLVLAVG
jgi:hypothetical protein